ncbi:MAG: alpha-ribazole phosphatase [Desulfuromonas sp.]|nr:MAG: alpha-ribazole phosphatase [Desulfuromonas sp.]
MESTRLHLLRHGQVEGFEEKRYNGQADVALTDLGREQYRRLQRLLENRPLSAIFSSDLARCVWGAELISRAHGLIPEQNLRLRELNIGEWEGKTWQQLMDEYPEEWQARLNDLLYYQVRGGESLSQMAERVRTALTEILQQHPGEEIVLVGHGGTNRVILLDAIGAPLTRMFHVEQDYGCYNMIDYYPDGIAVVKKLNG